MDIPTNFGQRPNTPLNITAGTDVVLNIRLWRKGTAILPDGLSDIQVYLISALGKKTPLSFTVSEGTVIALIPWSDELRPGYYDIEFKAKTDHGLTFVSRATRAIWYTYPTMSSPTEVSTDGDSHDLNMNISFLFGESPISGAEAGIEDGVGKPSVDVSYTNQILTFLFRNLRGDGIASMRQTASSDKPDGENVYVITTDSEKTLRLVIRNGSVGPKGDTVVLGDEKEYTLYNSTGDNTDGAMTQKAVTDFVNGKAVLVESEAAMATLIENGQYDPDKFYYTLEEEE